MKAMICRRDDRREDVRRDSALNGLDYLEVGPDRRTLTVYFLGKAPVSVEPPNILIEGGRRVRGIRVERVMVHRTELLELDDTMEIVVDREGDFSTYRLRVVATDAEGNTARHPQFDPHYDSLDFTFKVDCPSDLDCKPAHDCEPEPRDEPAINYLAKDYASFRQLMLDRLALVMPEWRERHVPDIGIALVEVLAYTGDHLSYYQDAVATEAYLDTARQRVSIRRHTRLVDYAMHEGCNARTWVSVETDTTVILPKDACFATRVQGPGPLTRDADLRALPSGAYEVFEPMARSPIALYPGHHEMRFYTWGNQECCLPIGTVEATLVGRWVRDEGKGAEPCEPKPPTPGQAQVPSASADGGPELHLARGEVLIIEEVIGPKTGAAADANPLHRHPVRLTNVEEVRDPLHPDLALTGITWAAEDALPFPVCLSAMGPPPLCEVVQDISVARGNLVLVDHGSSMVEDLEPVPVRKVIEECDCNGSVTDIVTVADRYRPRLKEAPMTFSEPLPADGPASRLLHQDPRRALPQALLTGTAPGSPSETWWPHRDLLGSGNNDPHFVVEIENDGRARLRFGDDELGRRPEARTAFRAAYRVGNGPAGNVGAGAIAHLVTRDAGLSGGVVSVRNPLPAQGGTAPEPIAEARLYAPYQFRQRLERAVTAEDYASLVMREFPAAIQRAAAIIRWNGSWHEVYVAVDPLGTEDADPDLLARIARRLYRYRRIGHDLVVRPAHRVPLDVELRVCVLPGYLRAHVKAALLEVLGSRRSASGSAGLFHPDRLSFGEGIYSSRLVTAAQTVAGVESVSVTRLNRLYEPANGEIEAGVLPLGPLEIARLDNDPGAPENGRLRLDMRGGR